ncbi:MAG: ABC transporter ATP-binding protein [Acutalibacteraceae bacterium]|nr:ABC transporter ATP-binding protein [Acutalibacteraceae bacterium]
MKFWFKYIKPYLINFILGPICMIVEVIGEVVMPFLLSRIINMAEAGTLTVQKALFIGFLMITVALLMMAGGVGGAYFGAKAAVYFASDVRRDIYKKIQSFSFKSIDKFSTGSLVTRTTNDVTQIQNFVNMLLRMALRSPGMLIGALIMAISLNPQLATVFAVSIPLMIIGIFIIISIGFPRFQKMQHQIDELNNTVQENINNQRVVKSFVREDNEKEKFRNSNSKLKNAGMAAMKAVIFMHPVNTIFMNLTIVAVVWFGSKMVLDGNMPVGDLSAFVTYVTQILFSLMMITMLLLTSSRALASAKRIKEVLLDETDITDDEAKCKDKRIENGKIELKNVSFRYYKNSSDKVLDDINLTIEAGSTVGIIGSTGCGKTTLVSMLPRLYDVDEGSVLIDGIDVRDYSIFNLREDVGMVLQKNVLFSGTIADNLSWGNMDASMEEIMEAAEYAQADKFVKGFSMGYDTELGEGGNTVSGGQKQRLCIARALLKKPKILILDDSTSAVDTATETMINKAFSEHLQETTKIIIAQRISSVKSADMIVVMNDGRITGVGDHNYLLENNNEYREIYQSQTNEKEE